MKKARHNSASAFQRSGSGCGFISLLPVELVIGHFDSRFTDR
jgi:hypothetical protein